MSLILMFFFFKLSFSSVSFCFGERMISSISVLVDDPDMGFGCDLNFAPLVASDMDLSKKLRVPEMGADSSC